MFGCLGKIWPYVWKAFWVGFLAMLLVGPASAQEKTPKKPPAPSPAKAPPCTGSSRKMSPARLKLRGLEGVESETAAPGMKKTTRKIGGQEIRAKPGEEEKK